MLLAGVARCLRAATPLAALLPDLAVAGRSGGTGAAIAGLRRLPLAQAPASSQPPLPCLTAAARTLWTSRPVAYDDAGSGSSPTSRKYSERKLIGYTPAQIYGVVADVGSYADFVPWCVRSTVLPEGGGGSEEGEGEEEGRATAPGSVPPPPREEETTTTTLEAELEVGFRAFSERYTSVVTLRPGGLLAATGGSASTTTTPAAAAAAAAATPATITSTVKGSTLFHHLDCTWAFSPGPAPGTAWLTFGIAFEFKSPLYRAVAAAFFDEVVRRMVAAFEGRCGAVYGGPAVSTARRTRVGVSSGGGVVARAKRPVPVG